MLGVDPDHAPLEIEALDLAEQHAHVREAPEDAAQRGRDLPARQQPRRHLVQQRLEDEVVRAVDQGDLRPAGLGQRARRAHAGEASTHDDDPMHQRGNSCSRVCTSANRSPNSATRESTSSEVNVTASLESAMSETSSQVSGVETVGRSIARSE